MAKNEVDKELIRELAALMDETGLSEIEIQNDDERLRLVRAASPAQASAAPAAVMPVAAQAVPAAAGAQAAEDDLSSHPGALLSPIVGTAYLAPAPDEAPFVKLGDQVSAEQTVLVIEAMKTFNEIPAGRAGVVRQILFENASPIEYGDVLMIID